MTLEQYEAKKKQFKDTLPKAKVPADPKVKKELAAQAERALLARASSKGRTSSVAPSEQPSAILEPGKSAVIMLASTTNTASGQASKQLVGPAQKKIARSAAKPAVTSSTVASESSKSSQPARAKTTQVAAAAPTTDPEPGTRLKHLKDKIASRSARSSPAPVSFAKSTKPVIKGFNALDQDSDDDSDSESDEDEDEEEKRVNVIRAAKPDQSTRSAVTHSDEDTGGSSEEEDED